MAKLKCDSWWGLGYAKPLSPNQVSRSVDGSKAHSAPPAPLTGSFSNDNMKGCNGVYERSVPGHSS